MARSEEDRKLFQTALQEALDRRAGRPAKSKPKPGLSPLRFEAKRYRWQYGDGYSDAPAPAPQGLPIDVLLKDAARRRRERAEEERNRRG